MKNKTTDNLKLGILIICGFGLLIAGLFFVGKNKNVLGKTFTIKSYFNNINGLTEGNNVRFAGIDVGTVKTIEMQNDTLILVEMIIKEQYLKFIRKNSMASIGTDGLMGNKIINIDAGNAETGFVKADDEIRSVKGINTEEMMRTLEYTNRNVALVSYNLKTITENITKGEGNLYSVLTDNEMAGKFHKSIINIQEISDQLNYTSKNISEIVKGVQNGEGTIGYLLKDSIAPEELQKIISDIKISGKNLSAATAQAETLFYNANSGKGTLSTLVNDTLSSASLKESIKNIEAASTKLNDDLEGLKHSILLRSYFRKLEKKKKKDPAK